MMKKVLFAGGAGGKKNGIVWNQATDVITRIGSAPNFNKTWPWSNIRRCNLADDGTVTAYYGDASFAYDGSNGQVMVEVPRFYYRFDHTATVHTPSVSREKLGGYAIHPAFVTDGRILDRFYTGAFEASVYDVSGSAYFTDDAAGVDFTASSGDKLSSIAGVKPASGANNPLTIVNARKLATNRGTGWGLLNFNQVCALQMLYAIEYGNWNSQSVLSTGVTNLASGSGNIGVNTGFTAGVGGAGSSDLGNASGYVSIAHYSLGTTTYPMSYRGVENFYGNLWKWVDGINIKADRKPWIADHDFASDAFTHPYSDTGLTLPSSDGYVSNLAYSAALDWAFLPSEAAGSTTTKLCDYYYQTTGNRAARFGGSWSYGADAGAFYWYLYSSSSGSNRDVGARLGFTPQN